MSSILTTIGLAVVFGATWVVGIYTPPAITYQLGMNVIKMGEIGCSMMRIVTTQVIPHAFYEFYMDSTQFLRNFVHYQLTNRTFEHYKLDLEDYDIIPKEDTHDPIEQYERVTESDWVKPRPDSPTRIPQSRYNLRKRNKLLKPSSTHVEDLPISASVPSAYKEKMEQALSSSCESPVS